MGVWRADDIEELREVYSSCKDDVDVITGMIHLMRKRRPRHKIANKMIELGIITDRRQLTKKKTNRKTKEEISPTNDEDDDSSGNESENDCEEFEQMSVTSLIEQLRNDEDCDVISDCFRWLSSSLQQVIADKEGTSEPSHRTSPSQLLDSIPLVPFTEHQEQLIGNPLLKSALMKIRLQSPNRDQIFWRIPKDMDTSEINQIIELLNIDDVSKFDDDTRPRNDDVTTQQQGHDKVDDVIVASSPEKIGETSTSSLQLDETISSNSSQNRENPKAETQETNLQDSDDDDDDVVVRKKRKKFRFDDSEDDE